MNRKPKKGENAYLQIGDEIASDGRWSVRRGLRVRSEMDGDSDGNRLERSRERENMEGVGLFRDKVQNV